MFGDALSEQRRAAARILGDSVLLQVSTFPYLTLVLFNMPRAFCDLSYDLISLLERFKEHQTTQYVCKSMEKWELKANMLENFKVAFNVLDS